MMLQIKFPGILRCALRKHKPTFRAIVVPLFSVSETSRRLDTCSQTRKYCGTMGTSETAHPKKQRKVTEVLELNDKHLFQSRHVKYYGSFLFRFHLHLNRQVRTELKFHAIPHSVFPSSLLFFGDLFHC